MPKSLAAQLIALTFLPGTVLFSCLFYAQLTRAWASIPIPCSDAVDLALRQPTTTPADSLVRAATAELEEHLNTQTLLLTWVPLVFVLAVDHALMRLVYKRASAIDHISSWTPSARTDVIFATFYYVLLPAIINVVRLLTLPGLVLVITVWVQQQTGWRGLLQEVVPTTGVVAVIAWFLAFDLCRYFAHILLHKVPALWRFHRLHHAGEKFNILVGTRVSLGELFFTDFVVFMMMSVVIAWPAPEVAFAVLLIKKVVDLLQHSNLPLDYGPLGCVVASPRFHRIHHSNIRADHDSNYADIFSIWDHVFRTANRRYMADPKVADDVTLGVTSADETAALNRTWLTSGLRDTFAEYALGAYRVVSAMFQRVFRNSALGAGVAAAVMGGTVGLALTAYSIREPLAAFVPAALQPIQAEGASAAQQRLRTLSRSGATFDVVFDRCAVDDSDWNPAADYLGTIKCGETYQVRYDGGATQWWGQGPNEANLAAGLVANAGATSDGEATAPDTFRLWGVTFAFDELGTVSTAQGEVVGQIKMGG